jgi:tRNA modification GTPase
VPFSTADTIVAIATPPGRGGIGVVRLSGPNASQVACVLMGRDEPLQVRHATFGYVVASRGPSRERVDQIVATWFAAPHSFTGDDVVELGAHGSMVLLQRIVELAIAAGARLAEPGEFTLRAYLHGRIDLIQAEAVADLVDAVTPLQARAAMDQLEGTLTTAIAGIDAALFDLAARLEASLDFPEEGFHFVTREETCAELAAIRARVDALIRDGRAGRVIREGRTVVITGRPNAGKSSLFNALAGAARAIVTDVPGTTRDLLTERVDIGGVPITLVDTAGLREARDAIEAEGVKRAREARDVAALTLVVVDGSEALSAGTHAVLDDASGPRLVVISKADLPRAFAREALGHAAAGAVDVSVDTREGLAELGARIVAALADRDDWRDVPAISNLRHLTLLGDAGDGLGRAEQVLRDGATEEVALAELGAARAALEAISGRRAPEDLLRHIFASFCIGK